MANPPVQESGTVSACQVCGGTHGQLLPGWGAGTLRHGNPSDCIDELLARAVPRQITDEMVERAARELHRQQGHHPASWHGHCLTAAKAILHAALRSP